MRLAAIALVVATALGACVGNASLEPAQHQASAAERVAADLLAADEAEGAGNRAALAARLSRLHNRGTRALDEEAEASLLRWQAMSAPGAAPMRGRALGPGFRRGTLAVGQRLRLEQVFRSGEPAEIVLAGRKQHRLKLILRDAKARTVCDLDPVNGRGCQFTPVFTQRYVIEIANGGAGVATYYLVFD